MLSRHFPVCPILFPSMNCRLLLFSGFLACLAPLRAQTGSTELPGLTDAAPPPAAAEGQKPGAAEPSPGEIRKKADAGSAPDQLRLADLILKGIEKPRTPDEALTLLEKAADAGHAPGQFALASLLMSGMAQVKPDPERAKFLIQQAAEAGFAPAQAAYGNLLYSQIDLKNRELNFTEPLAYYRKAADQGNMEAVYRMGMMQLAGYGLPQDAAAAWRLLQKSARAGHAPALYEAAVSLQQGRGVEPDPIAAIGYLHAAADLGNLDAAMNLADCYLTARGVPASPDKAGSLLAAAARQNFGPAQLRLGEMFEKGHGTKPNLVSAGINYLLAAANGVPAGNDLYAALKKKLSKKEVKEVEDAVKGVMERKTGTK